MAFRMCSRAKPLAEAEAAQARRPRRARGLADKSRSSPSIRSTPRITTTRCSPSPIPIRTIAAASSSTVAIADVAHYVRPAPRSIARRWNAAIRSISPTASCRCCRSGSPTISARSSRTVDRAALAVRMVIGADGRKRSHTFHRVLMRSAAKLHYAQAQDAIDGRHRRHHRPAAASRSSSRSTPPIAPSRRRATNAVRSISTCPSAKSCSSPTARSIASSSRSGSTRTG